MADPQILFDYQLWIARYPELGVVPELTAQLYWDEATLYHRNDGTLVADDAQQRILLNMLTAHIAALNTLGADGSASPLVGPITSASEGSVSVGVTPLAAPGTQAWLVLSRYGASYWYAMAPYRTARYVPGYPRQFNPPYVRVFRRS